MLRSGAQRSWFVVLALFGLAAGAPLGCGPVEGPDDPEASVARNVLANVGPGVVLPAVERFQERAAALSAAAAVWSGDEAGRAVVQAAWNEAFVAWQAIEVMQVGPAGSSLTVVGGLDLRDAVYSWPSVSRCKVDQATLEGGWDAEDFFRTATVDLLGLDALETILFSTPGENACLGSVGMNRDGSWDAVGVEGIQAARASQAAALAAEVVAVADQLHAAWSAEGDDWSTVLAEAGEEGNPYPSIEAGLDDVFRALFYVELGVKDRKLGEVLGLVDCEVESCPQNVEAQLANASVAAVAANLEGFEALYLGGEGAGLDDLLVDRGHEDVHEAIVAELARAQAAVASLTLPLEDAATDAAALAAFEEVKRLTDLVKGDLATVLSLTVPAEAAGDND